MTASNNDLLVGPVIPANGVTLISIDFFFEDETHLEVYISGQNAPLTLGVDYTVSEPTNEAALDGSITLTTPANGTDTYSIFGKQPLERTSDLQFRGDLRSPVLNQELDRLWRSVQGVNTALLRSFLFSQTSDIPDALDTTTAAGRVGTVIGFSTDGSQLSLVQLQALDAVQVPASSTDNAIVRWDGVSGASLQNSGVTVDDSDNVSTTGLARFLDGVLSGLVTFGRSSADAVIDVDPGNVDSTSRFRLLIDGAQRILATATGMVIGTGSADRTLRLSGTDALRLTVGTTAQRPGSPEEGDVRRNSEIGQWEGYDGATWGSLGGAGLFKGENGESGDVVNGAGDIFRVHENTLNTDTTIDADENAVAVGPLTIASGVTLTVNGELVIV